MRDARESIAVTDDEIAPGLQGRNQVFDHAFLGIRVEVDQYIAQQDDVELPEVRQAFVQIGASALHAVTERALYQELTRIGTGALETEPLQVVVRYGIRPREIIKAGAGGLQYPRTDVGAENVPLRAGQLRRQHHRDTVRLLATRTSGAPHAKSTSGLDLAQHLRP